MENATHVFVIDDHSLTILHIYPVGATDPSLPKDTVNPSECHLFPLRLVHVDPDALSGPQGPCIAAVLGLVDAQLLGVAELLALELEQLDLLVHPLVGGALHLALGALEGVVVVPVEDPQDDELAVHDLAGVGCCQLRHDRQPHGFHPVEDLADIAHCLGREWRVVRRSSLSCGEQPGPRSDLEPLIQLRVTGLDQLGTPDEAQWEPL